MNVLIITAKNIVKWSKCEVPLHICKKNRRLFNKQFREEKKTLKIIIILIDQFSFKFKFCLTESTEINRTEIKMNKHIFNYSWIEEMKQRDM